MRFSLGASADRQKGVRSAHAHGPQRDDRRLLFHDVHRELLGGGLLDHERLLCSLRRVEISVLLEGSERERGGGPHRREVARATLLERVRHRRVAEWRVEELTLLRPRPEGVPQLHVEVNAFLVVLGLLHAGSRMGPGREWRLVLEMARDQLGKVAARAAAAARRAPIGYAVDALHWRCGGLLEDPGPLSIFLLSCAVLTCAIRARRHLAEM